MPHFEGTVEFESPSCSRCLALTPANIELRRVCTERQSHRAYLGREVEHDGGILRVCLDCGTLVVPLMQ